MPLPRVECAEDVDRLRRDPERSREALRAATQAIGLTGGEISLFEDGSNLIGAIGDSVIKLFAPIDRQHYVTEQRSLEFLDARLPVATPKLREHGELEGWGYIVMSKLEGALLASIWSDLSARDRTTIARDIGSVTAALHSLDIERVDTRRVDTRRVDTGRIDTTRLDTEPLDLQPSWIPFLEQQRRGVVEKQRRAGLDLHWLQQIEPFLDSTELPEAPPVFLHTELAREHFLVKPSDDGWTLSGLLDFEPSMVGHPEYEFASVGLFVTRGDPRLMRACLSGYRESSNRSDPQHCAESLSQRFLAYTLLHRYSRLPWYLQFMPLRGAQTLESLARSWFGVD